MKDKQCKDCQYYYQHYSLDKRKIFQVCCGHCTFSGSRRKLPDAAACNSFTPAAPREQAFASKEYLSKELLQYVLKLDLLPNIEKEEY